MREYGLALQDEENEEKLAGQGEARLRLLTNATYPRPGDGHASVHSVSDGQKRIVVLLQCSSTPSLFDFLKRRRAKRSPNARVAVSCVE